MMDCSGTCQPWLLFRHPLVRELAFCIASPPLLAQWPPALALMSAALIARPDIELPNHHFWQQQFANYHSRLQQLDSNPQPLEQHMLNLRSPRLGIRFEHLLAFWLQDSTYHPFSLLGQGIKRMDGPRTLGEMDFLILNRNTQKIEHWEVAIKFYLGEADFRPGHWLGPNRQDSLERKLKHLCQHQFNVTHAQGYPIDQRRAIIKGRLFYPAGNAQPAADNAQLSFAHFPDWAAPQHLSGFWGYTVPPAPAGFRWRYAGRQEWMATQPEAQWGTAAMHPAGCTNSVYWRNGLYLLLNTENKPVLQYMLRISDKTGQSIKNYNILKPNPNVADIFNQISII